MVGGLWLDVTLNMVGLCCFVWLWLFCGLVYCVIVVGLDWFGCCTIRAGLRFYGVFVWLICGVL